MQGSIVNQFNQQTPEKPVNRMSLVVLDIECIENNIVKEVGVYKDRQTVGYYFLPPKKIKPTSQSSCCTKHLHGISSRSGYEKYTELEKTLNSSTCRHNTRVELEALVIENCCKGRSEYSRVFYFRKFELWRHIEKCKNGHFEPKSDEKQNNS